MGRPGHRTAVFTALFAASLLLPRIASAFCRITTTMTAVDGPDTTACYDTTHPPVWWSSPCIGVSVQKDGSRYVSADVVDQILFRIVFPNWTQASCPTGGHPSISFSDLGFAACHEQQANVYGPNANVVMFHDDAWPYDEAEGTIALTTVTFHPETGELWDADIEINSANHPLSTSVPVPSGAYDLQSILQHETGHFLGLAHPPDPSAVMYYLYTPGDDGKRTLNVDDIDGVCTIYEPGGARTVARTVVPDGLMPAGTCDAQPRNGFSSACVPPSEDQPTSASTACTCRAGASEWSPLSTLAGASFAAFAFGRRRRRRAAAARPGEG